jgi:RNA polymerase sigma factor (sigma-70 family)
LLNAVDKFNYSLGFRFSTYATHAIRREFYHRICRRKNERTKFTSDLEPAPAGTSSQGDMQDEELEQFHRYQWVMRLIKTELDDRDQSILSLRFGFTEPDGQQTLTKVGEKLGLSKERVRQLQMRAIETVRQAAGINVSPEQPQLKIEL